MKIRALFDAHTIGALGEVYEGEDGVFDVPDHIGQHLITFPHYEVYNGPDEVRVDKQTAVDAAVEAALAKVRTDHEAALAQLRSDHEADKRAAVDTALTQQLEELTSEPAGTAPAGPPAADKATKPKT
jgi:hypothetical protein